MVRKRLVVLLIASAIIIFFGLAGAETVTSLPDGLDSLVVPTDLSAGRQDTTFTVEPLGEEFAPAPWCEPCGKHFLLKKGSKDTSDPSAIIMFLNRFKDIRFEYQQEVLISQLTVNVKMRGIVPQARLNYQSDYVSAEIWVPMDELNQCPRLKALVKVPFR